MSIASTTVGGDVKFQISSKRLGGLHVIANGHIDAQYIKKCGLESNTRVPSSSHNNSLVLDDKQGSKPLL